MVSDLVFDGPCGRRTNRANIIVYCAGVFIDLKKAFDTVDHFLLVKKLNVYGIRGMANDWVKNYLNNKKQYVMVDDHNSNLLNITCGVPQGSVSGPILFIIYINDICNVP